MNKVSHVIFSDVLYEKKTTVGTAPSTTELYYYKARVRKIKKLESFGTQNKYIFNIFVQNSIILLLLEY